MSVKSETTVSVINRIRLLMHEIRTNCTFDKSVKLCLRYTARDPRLRFNSLRTQNNCGELTGGALHVFSSSSFVVVV